MKNCAYGCDPALCGFKLKAPVSDSEQVLRSSKKQVRSEWMNRKSERIIKKDRIPYGRRSLQIAAGIFN
jgi:hypothetical protein